MFRSRRLAGHAYAMPSVETNASNGAGQLLGLLDALTGPLLHVVTLWGLALYVEGGLYPSYLLLSLLVFVLTYPSRGYLRATGVLSLLFNVLFGWAWVFLLMYALGYVTDYLREFDDQVLLYWLVAAPAAEYAAGLLLRWAAPSLAALEGPPPRAIIAGMNGQGVVLAKRMQSARYNPIELVGFVDNRSPHRLVNAGQQRLIGKLEELPQLVQQHRVQHIYLSLPMASQPRILKLLDDLKDTTASIYFVPDLFVTDLIQGSTSNINGVPVISVCESPFLGFNGVIKRGSDIVLAALILLLISPLLVAIALAVKFTSPGPVIFKQRRYGQGGEEILVYKFRSMSVTEDGGQIKQAQKNDSRITPLGAILRKTSLDELPQFINVLQGRMSIVGPRPHAVAHNELYRKLIKGYMVRHKVKPGITGWAQVNGYRGETDTLDKMQGRIDYDLDYLRNWSLRLDLFIILKTMRLVTKDAQAY